MTDIDAALEAAARIWDDVQGVRLQRAVNNDVELPPAPKRLDARRRAVLAAVVCPRCGTTLARAHPAHSWNPGEPAIVVYEPPGEPTEAGRAYLCQRHAEPAERLVILDEGRVRVALAVAWSRRIGAHADQMPPARVTSAGRVLA